MSRNFELLQNLGKDQLVVDTVIPAQPELEPEPVAEPMAVIEPQLKLEPVEHEQLTKLVQRVFLLPGAESPHTVIFSASESGNGASWICARAAETLAAQVSSNVFLVDANLRKPGLHEQFGLDNSEGFTDALRGRASMREFARQLSRPNLWLVTAGSSAEASEAAPGSPRVRQKLAELRSPGDYVLIDAPAINVANDAAALGANADGLIVVLRANASRREPARKMVQELVAAKVKILGAVLNQRTFPIPDSIYHRL